MMELDGHPVTPDDLAGLALRNYGHFTTLLVEDSAVRGLRLHLDRLVGDCRTIFDAELDPTRVRSLIRQAAAGTAQPVILRVTVFDPALELSRPGAAATPRVLVTARAAPTGPLPALRLRSVRYQRDLPAVKHAGLFGTLYHRRAAQRDGYDDVLFVDPTDHVTEGASWNVGCYDGTRILWPDSDCLPGVTTRLLARTPLGTAAATARLPLTHLAGMRAAFSTNAAVGVRPIESIDDTTFAGDPGFIERLQAQYAAIPAEPL